MGIFGIIKESLQAKKITVSNGEPNNEQIFSYLHENIYSRENIAVKTIVSHFNISVKYFSNYFKRNFGVAYQGYLDSYRIELIEERIEIGGLKLKQIADEFGFTDASHLPKVFKKMKGVSPTKYRSDANR